MKVLPSLVILACYLLSYQLLAAAPDSKPAQVFVNPILPGGYPDPSICRDGEDFYIVNSTFEYFPGLPIHHSKDLVNWELIGYGLHRASQVSSEVNLIDVQSDGGIHAPTLRCRDGKFYIITTNVYVPPGSKDTQFVNFVITADNPRGPWSEPKVLEGAPGIDPDIFFDDDGRVWYVGTRSPENPNFAGEGEIWLQEIDTQTWSLIGKRHALWRGACGGIWVEGPHMYKQDGKYYLMVAEGGTSFNHAVMIAVSDEITGPFISNERNPIMTTRHLSYRNWVHSTGHADMVQLQDGRWYMVLLGIRSEEGTASNMGRETHLVPMDWEREPFWWKEEKHLWPVVAPQTGRVERHTPVPFEGTVQRRSLAFKDNFDASALALNWNFRRLPKDNTYSLKTRPGYLRLFTNENVIHERASASLMGFRQTATEFDYTASMTFTPSNNNSEAGIILFQKDNNYISFTAKPYGDKWQLTAKHSEVGDNEQHIIGVHVLNQMFIPPPKGPIYFRFLSQDGRYRLAYSTDNGNTYHPFASAPSDGVISRKYTGAYLGVYATGNGVETGDYADFDWVSYQGFEKQ